MTEWREKALCRDMGPSPFYGTSSWAVAAAKQFCLDCPVISECLAEALARPEQFGVWGGKSVNERRKIRRGETPKQPSGKRRAPRRLPAEFDRLVDQYTRAGHTAEQIAEQLQVHERTVERARARNRERIAA